MFSNAISREQLSVTHISVLSATWEVNWFQPPMLQKIHSAINNIYCLFYAQNCHFLCVKTVFRTEICLGIAQLLTNCLSQWGHAWQRIMRFGRRFCLIELRSDWAMDWTVDGPAEATVIRWKESSSFWKCFITEEASGREPSDERLFCSRHGSKKLGVLLGMVFWTCRLLFPSPCLCSIFYQKRDQNKK